MNKVTDLFYTLFGSKPRYGLSAGVIGDSFIALPDTQDSFHRGRRLIDSSKLTKREKEDAKYRLSVTKDFYNLVNRREDKYQCSKCHREGYTMLNCEHCVRLALQGLFETWSNRDRGGIDDAIKRAQMELPLPEFIVEWIPYKNLTKIKEDETAIWTKGRICGFNDGSFKRIGAEAVILRHNNNGNFINEFRTRIELRNKGYLLLSCLGVSRIPQSREFVFVLEKMECSLEEYIREHRSTLTWKLVYRVFFELAHTLYGLHSRGLIHCDIQPGSVLLSKAGTWCIAGLGRDRNAATSYRRTAPEVLEKRVYQIESDIYSFGMLMWQVATGEVPFCDRNDDANLANEVLNSLLRPSTSIVGVPKQYKSMMQKCWDADPNKRPIVKELRNFFEIELKDLTVQGDSDGGKVFPTNRL